MVEARILIADDSKMNQQILSEILGDRYEYLYADDGMQALDLLHSEFDIDLLLDINMPRLDGFGVLEVMKQHNWLQEIPVIITSSEDDESFIQKAYELGVTDYIRRPFNLTVTQRRVSSALTLYAREAPCPPGRRAGLRAREDEQRHHQHSEPRRRVAQFRIRHAHSACAHHHRHSAAPARLHISERRAK